MTIGISPGWRLRLPFGTGVARDAPAAAKHEIAARYRSLAALAPEAAAAECRSTPTGLDERTAAARLAETGPNAVARKAEAGILRQLLEHFWSPLNLLLAVLAVLSAFDDLRAALMIVAIVALSVVLSFVQEYRSNRAAAALSAMVRTTATVLRPGDAGTEPRRVEEPIERLVPGDVVRLAAGDMVPADLRLLAAKDLHVNEAALTGEAVPAEKTAAAIADPAEDPLAIANLCFMGTNVVSGTALGLVMVTGRATYFGHIADAIAARRPPSAFETGISRFVWLMIRVMAVMVPAVLVINGVTKGDWFEALLFAVAVAVGLTPEMLPMIVTMNLAKGSLAMAREKVIVKRLEAIQNFGAMDVLCTDKTGTLTQDRIILKRHLDFAGNESSRVLEYAYLNSYWQSGLKNLLDAAVLNHVEVHRDIRAEHAFRKVDEIPFDFERRRMSVVLQQEDGSHLLVCKGAVEEIFAVATEWELGDDAARAEHGPLDATHFAAAREATARLNADGFRVVAVAVKRLDGTQGAYGVADEAGLTLVGYVAFLDPPKDSAAPALRALAAQGIAVKVLTGDNDIVTRKICAEVGLPPGRVLLGADVARMSAAELDGAVEETCIFAKLSPSQKAEVVAALHRRGHVVGFLGDGINDGPALRAADVGVSVDSAVDIAKESADIILLEKSLAVLSEGVVEGRRVFGNIVKYLKMGASSNFGNMLSVVGASIFLPFLPMAPIQVLANNLLYDLSQTTIPTDAVDDEYLARPRRWEIGTILRFMLMIGPVSSLFDYATFGIMLLVFGAWTNPALFQTAWFVESLMTQTLIIHVIRTARIPFVESRASPQLVATSLLVAAAAAVIPSTPLGAALGFVPLPWLWWPLLALMMAAYMALTHAMKTVFTRRYGLG